MRHTSSVATLSTGQRRTFGGLAVAAAFGIFAAIQASKAHHSTWWVVLISAGIIAVLTGVSFWSYWTVAPKIGRATALAGLSIAWGVVLLGAGWLSTSGAEGGEGNLAGYAITGALIPWLVAAMTIPFAWIIRGARRAVEFKRSGGIAARRGASLISRPGSSRARGSVSSQKDSVIHQGRYTAPKASRHS